MNKLHCFGIMCLILFSISGLNKPAMGQNQTITCPSGTYLTSGYKCSQYQQHVLAPAVPVPIPMKTYSDFGLGFKMQVPSYLVVHRGAGNVTLRNPTSFNDSSNYFRIWTSVNPYSKFVFPMDRSFTPNLDDFAKHIGLVLASLYSKDNDETLTNKTKLVIGNGTSAYLFQSETTLNNTAVNNGQKLLYRSYYVMFNDNLVYAITFYTFNQPKFLSIEQKIKQSLRFI